jgi:hypothetical protein
MKLILFSIIACTNEADQKTDTSSTSEQNEEETNEEETNEEETNEEETNEEEIQNSDEVICSQISLEECDSFEVCELVSGSPIVINDNGEECVDYATQEPQACVEFGCSADPTITIASPPNSDQCWMFGSGCLPEDWSYCDSSPQDCQ